MKPCPKSQAFRYRRVDTVLLGGSSEAELRLGLQHLVQRVTRLHLDQDLAVVIALDGPLFQGSHCLDLPAIEYEWTPRALAVPRWPTSGRRRIGRFCHSRKVVAISSNVFHPSVEVYRALPVGGGG